MLRELLILWVKELLIHGAPLYLLITIVAYILKRK